MSLTRSRTAPGRRLLPPARLVAPALFVALLVVLLAPVLVRDARAEEPDYSGWRDLLQRYVKVQAEKGKPWDSRFDYQRLYVDEGIITKHRADGLAALHDRLLSVRPSDLSPAERTAWAINTYNFLVVERMTLLLLVPGRKLMRYDSPLQANTVDGPFFAAPVAKVGGREFSLSGFERWFVYGDTSGDVLVDALTGRERPGDPRLMFALCKAALCTGPVLPWVYRADSLDAQLDRAVRMALARPEFVRADVATGQLEATNRFFDERADFGGPELPGVVPLLRKYGTPATRKLISARKLTRPTRFFEPDWKLNIYVWPSPKLPGQEGALAAPEARKSP